MSAAALPCDTAAPQYLHTDAEKIMAKGMEQKKDAKKKPEKTMKEKRLEKNAKKQAKTFGPAK